MSCCFLLIFWMTSGTSTLDELLKCCQRFDVQWIRLTLIGESYPSWFDCTAVFSFRSSYPENPFTQGEKSRPAGFEPSTASVRWILYGCPYYPTPMYGGIKSLLFPHVGVGMSKISILTIPCFSGCTRLHTA